MLITTEMISHFANTLQMQEKSAATIEKYVRDVRRFARFAAGQSITRQLVLDYKAALTATYKARSVNSMLASLNAFLHFIGCDDCRVRQLRVQNETYCTEEKELSRQEYCRLVKTAAALGDKRMSLLLQTLCSTGIRISELPYITVEAVREGRVEIRCKGKSRMVFLPTQLQNKLLRYCKAIRRHYGPVFCTRSGAAMDRSNIWHAMKRLCLAAGVSPKKVFPHNLRHLFARTFYELEKDLSKLADLLGHSSINTTRIYIMSSGAEHRQRMEQMHLVL